MSSPTSRTLSLLRSQGWLAEVVERWMPHVGIRRDFLGVGDVLALKVGEPPLLIQCTSAPNVSARVHKAERERRLRTWLACGHRFEVHGWRKRDGRWELRKIPLLLDKLAGIAAKPPERRKPRKVGPCLFE